MKEIVFIVPYFGKTPDNFQLWLESCKYNRDIDWFIFSDLLLDKFDVPDNVTIYKYTFDNFKKRVQTYFDFEISLDDPYKLCDYRPAYGEIFQDEIKEYSFWGFCDVDLIFGDLRKFITKRILEDFKKVGFQGHMTIFENSKKNNEVYKTIVDGIVNYKEAFTNSKSYCFDEEILDLIFQRLEIPTYRDVHFAHLLKYAPDFYLGKFPYSEGFKNENQIFYWEEGRLFRQYLYDDKIYVEEFLYIHFFCRKMKYINRKNASITRLIIFPNFIEVPNDNFCVDKKYILKKSHINRIKFYLDYLYYNRKKITIKKILNYMYQKKKQNREIKKGAIEQ